MSKTEADYAVGYGRPPLHSRWTKGQCGNPRYVRGNRQRKAKDIVEEIFNRKVKVASNGKKQEITIFQVIVSQLWLKALTDRRAVSVMHKYEAYARRHMENGGMQIVVVPDEQRQK